MFCIKELGMVLSRVFRIPMLGSSVQIWKPLNASDCDPAGKSKFLMEN
jgi:hypothetical protein